MDKRTFIAIAISVVIFTIWFGVQNKNTNEASNNGAGASLSSSDAANGADTSTANEITPVPVTQTATDNSLFSDYTSSDLDGDIAGNTDNSTDNSAQIPLELQEKIISISTDVYDIELSSKNATIQSIQLKKNAIGIASTPNIDTELFPQSDLYQGLRILWGDETFDKYSDLKDIYYYVNEKSRNGSQEIEFSRVFQNSDGAIFTAYKTFLFKDGENLFELKVRIENKENKILKLGDNYAYSLLFGPQLGPYAEVVDTQKSKQLSRRRLVGRDNKKVRNINLKQDRNLEKKDLYRWVGISGRYISMLILTGSTSYTTQYSSYNQEGFNSGAQLLLRRPEIQSSATEDRYKIYLGPNVRNTLKRYNISADNAFEIQDARFEDIKPSRLLSFLERPIYLLLLFLYKLIPNFGVAIILLTLIMRGITLPVIRKSKASSEKMKALGPKMKTIREKFKDDPMKMNQEIMDLYKREKVSPFSSMLPMFIQLPFFLAMYRVIYESYDLWKAPFFGWITDLSIPDEFVSFGDFTVPIIGWNGLHLLPIIMLATQYISSFIMMKQQDSSGSQKLIFIMSYVFPFMIFFALYNSPSGLILYWICSNIFTVLAMTNWKKKKIQNEPILKKNRKKITT